MKREVERFVLAVTGAALAMWLLAGLWHELLMAHFYGQNLHGEHEGVAIIAAAYVVLALLMVYLYPMFRQEERPLLRGAKFGVIIGILWVFPHELVMAAAHGKPLLYVFQNGVWHMLEQGLGGVMIAWVYERKRKEAGS